MRGANHPLAVDAGFFDAEAVAERATVKGMHCGWFPPHCTPQEDERQRRPKGGNGDELGIENHEAGDADTSVNRNINTQVPGTFNFV